MARRLNEGNTKSMLDALCEVLTVDNFRSEVIYSREARLKKNPNVNLRYGNGALVPTYMVLQLDERTLIQLDGIKGGLALNLIMMRFCH
jgi:hypothetical protein